MAKIKGVSKKKQVKATTKAKTKKPLQKKAMAKSRRPFVELKAIDNKYIWNKAGGGVAVVDTLVDPQELQYMTDGSITQAPAQVKLIPIWCYINPRQGVYKTDMIGNYMTPKYLTAKISVKFPATINNQVCPRIYVLHGWITKPLNLNSFTTPMDTQFTRTDMNDYISSTIQPFFEDGRLEFTTFKEKSKRDFKILGYKRIEVRNKDQLGILPGRVADNTGTSVSLVEVGDRPVQDLTLTWKLSDRKVKYTLGYTPSSSTDMPFMYPNDSFIPFALMYSPDYENIPDGVLSSFSFRNNAKCWFSDS